VRCEPKADRGLGQVHRSKAVPGSARCRRLDRDGPIRDTPSPYVAFRSAMERNPDRGKNAAQVDPLNADLSRNYPCGWQSQRSRSRLWSAPQSL
jgi:hypothetical protein